MPDTPHMNSTTPHSSNANGGLLLLLGFNHLINLCFLRSNVPEKRGELHYNTFVTLSVTSKFLPRPFPHLFPFWNSHSGFCSELFLESSIRHFPKNFLCLIPFWVFLPGFYGEHFSRSSLLDPPSSFSTKSIFLVLSFWISIKAFPGIFLVFLFVPSHHMSRCSGCG